MSETELIQIYEKVGCTTCNDLFVK